MSEYLIAHIEHSLSHNEHICWWRPESKGYTICVDKAGVYAEQEARSICCHGSCIAAPKHEAVKLARSTPYYRLSDGTLAKLYDGDKHSPVPNGRKEWKALIEARLDTGAHAKPTPIGKKARAIYLPKQEGGA